MSIEIQRNVRAQIDRLLRNAQATGPATAANPQGPMLLNEVWAADPDTTNRYSTTLGGTGTATNQTNTGRKVCRLDCAAAGDTVQLASKPVATNPSNADPNKDIYQRLVLEFEMALANVASIDNAEFFVGLAGGANPRRGTADLIGFCLGSDALKTLTDSAGTETETAVASAPTLTAFNRYKIVVRKNAVDFLVNNVLKNTHTANITTARVYVGAYIKAEAATGQCNADLGALRWWYEDAV